MFKIAGMALLGAISLAMAPSSLFAQEQPGWTGNLVVNPGFEEDFINLNGESHVLSFKGDWYYNQKDFVPDYWQFKGNYSWGERAPHSGQHSLVLEADASASQSFKRASVEEGGGAWGGVNTLAITLDEANLAKFNQPWQASVWVRGGGTIVLGSEKATAPAGGDWQLLTVQLPADKIGPPEAGVGLTLIGPGEFDDVIVLEKLPDTPNLVANASFEQLDKEGYPAGWSAQKKYRAIGPTYYVWTDWNHYFSGNRGPVAAESLISHAGAKSLRFDVYPGDEKLVESDLITLNQTTANIVEVGAFVRADRIKLIDIRCVDQDGIYMPGVRPRQPEYKNGGTFLYGNGNFEWRYVRKFFATPEGKPVTGIKVRLCARGMNGHTLDDAGTRAYCMQVGTVWWDDIRVTERTSDASTLQGRGVKVPVQPALPTTELANAELNLGERFFGGNTLSYNFTNGGAAGPFQLTLTTTLPGEKAIVSKSAAVNVAAGAKGTLSVAYAVPKLVGDLDKQATMKLELTRANQPVAASTYAFNTWPVVADFDVSRHYNLPEENPVTVSVNLGVSAQTLAAAAKTELQLVRIADQAVLATQTFANLKETFAQTLAALPKTEAESYEFNFPKPDFWADRTNLIIAKIDLSPLKVWPHDQPTRDTVLVIRGLDAQGKELFRDQSEPFCRMNQTPPQDPIKTVKVREDGAILINEQPRFLFGATHQHQRLSHSLPIIAQLGLMGHRLSQGMDFATHREMWNKYRLYTLQMKPGEKFGGTVPIVEMTPEEKAAFEAFVAANGMENVVSINTGGWEATIDFNDHAVVEKHLATNDYIRKLTGRPTAISTSGAYNAWWLQKLTPYDIDHAETEMWGPMDFNVIYTPYMKRAGKTTAWVYLPQLYDNTPHSRYRFESYENIIRGSAGVSMIQGIGDPTFNRGLAGELRYLEKPLNSQEPAPAVALEPNISHKVSRHAGKTYVVATNAGPISIGNWKWNTEQKQSGRASHEGDSVNTQWFRPDGIRIHGFRGLQLPEMIQAGDKIVQYVWIDPQEKPDWAMLCVRGDGRFAHNAVLGPFEYEPFRAAKGNLLMYSELNHSVWHEVNWVMDPATHARAVKTMGKAQADAILQGAETGRATVDKMAYQAEHFHNQGALPEAGQWHRIELDADKLGLTGKLVDGFAYLTRNGRALWDFSALMRNGKIVRVFCEDTVGIDRELLTSVRVQVPGLKAGAKVNVLFEGRTLTADADGSFVDDFQGVDSYGYEAGGIQGDLFGFVRDEDREISLMMPSGYGYTYGPTAVHVYEIEH
jgi:hypothetical protein